MLGDSVQAARFQRVVTVEPARDLARCTRHSLVDCVALPPIGLANPVGKFRLELTNQIDRSVRRAAVDNDVFQVRIPLFMNRTQRLLKKSCLVVTGSDHRDAGSFAHSSEFCDRRTD